MHKMLLEFAMKKGKAYPKTTPRRYIGIANQPSKAMLLHNMLSEIAIITDEAFQRIWWKPGDGINWLLTKALKLPRNNIWSFTLKVI